MPSSPRPRAVLRSAPIAGLAVGLMAAAVAIGIGGARAAAPTPQQLAALEQALNSEGDGPLNAVLDEGPGFDPAALAGRRRALMQQFPDARWALRPGQPTSDGQPTVNLSVTGTRQQGDTTFRLEAEQRLKLSSSGARINGQTVLAQQSLLRSGETPVRVSLLIPDVVLTGQRYDLDVIFDDPLDGAFAAGGVTAVSEDQVGGLESPRLDLRILPSGGIFKTVQAPFRPGSQTWAVMLVHPEGIVSATKQVRVVADRSALSP